MLCRWFDVLIETVSLLDFVECVPAREQLQIATQSREAGDLDAGLKACALAFHELISDYEDRKTKFYKRSPFSFGPTLRNDSTNLSRGLEKVNSYDREVGAGLRRLAETTSRTVEAVAEVQSALKILGLGLDYKRYTRFRLVTPGVVEIRTTGDRELIFRQESGDARAGVNANDLSFAIEFVIESALRLQEFDYEVSQREII